MRVTMHISTGYGRRGTEVDLDDSLARQLIKSGRATAVAVAKAPKPAAPAAPAEPQEA